jgi:deoxyribonuclease V
LGCAEYLASGASRRPRCPRAAPGPDAPPHEDVGSAPETLRAGPIVSGMRIGWPRDAPELESLQRELARSAATAPRWWPPTDRSVAIGALFVASSISGADRCWVGACVVRARRMLSSAVVSDEPDAPYVPGYLALRVGPLLERAVRQLDADFDVLLVNATGRDHPRGGGLALHLGAALNVPTIGVTDRPLVAEAAGEPGDDRGSWVRLVLDGQVVGLVVRTRGGAKPVVVHAAWRTDPEAARSLVLAAGGSVRTPEPIRHARQLARLARAAAEGRLQVSADHLAPMTAPLHGANARSGQAE